MSHSAPAEPRSTSISAEAETGMFRLLDTKFNVKSLYNIQLKEHHFMLPPHQPVINSSK